MEMKHLVVGLAPVLLCIGSAHAAFVYDFANQSSGGFVSAFGGGSALDGYGLNPPNSLESWSTGEQDISAIAPAGARARLRTSYSSTLEPERLAFEGRILEASASFPGPSSAEFSYQQVLSVAFHVDSPMQVLLSASMSRTTLAGEPPFTPMTLEFGRKDGSPLISFAYPGEEANFSASFGTTSVLLLPGDYTLAIFTTNFFKGSSAASFAESINFEARVPAPTALSLAPLAMAFGLRRRSR